MKRTSVADMTCSVAQCLEVIGDWWTPLIVRDLLLGVTRFDELQDRLGISRNVLAARLDSLVEHDIVERQAYQDNPPRHDYVLTPKGQGLWTVIDAMRQWGDQWFAPHGPPVQLVHRTCGHDMTPALTCSACGDPLVYGEMLAVPGPGADDDGGPLPRRRAARA